MVLYGVRLCVGIKFRPFDRVFVLLRFVCEANNSIILGNEG